MALCKQCGTVILFGGRRVNDLRFCSEPCQTEYECEIYLPGAQKRYHALLAQLRLAPTDPLLKQRTLAAGRTYASWTRRSSGSGNRVTLFDEMALANDIQAACAAASTPSPLPAESLTLTAEQRLERLDSLKKRALISEQEYAARRSAILEELRPEGSDEQ